ncbi:60Kd inner membrane protein [Popillia japonica]|uniref:60Kd inner membrane protein n=1 Tax=Popillia japonica TaxID=7064 RepID=A0AAW1L4P2_POPJA
MSSKYKSYVNILRKFKDNLYNKKDLKLNERCEELLQTVTSLECRQCMKSPYSGQRLSDGKFIQNYKKLLYNVQDTLLQKNIQKGDNEWPNKTDVQHNRLSKRIFSLTALSAAAVHVVDKAPGTEANVNITQSIPEPPPIPEASAEVLNQLNALGEPTFLSLGLGGWSPIGIVQTALEYVHVTLGVPWWGAIVIGTIVIRVCMFPLVVVAQRNAAKMNNYMPQLQVLQLKMSEARRAGNQLEVARYSQELMLFMKEKQLNPFKNMIVPLAQMPVFISFFMGLRQMANVPVESLRNGGMFWFTDLTIPDQYFALPIITSLTLWATIELGTDAARLSSQNLQTMKYVLRALPLFIVPFTVNFPGAILCYWVSTNFISLLQVGFLRIPAVREYFRIEALVTHNPDKLPVKTKGFTEGIKDSWTNLKISRELEERRRLDEIQFQRAGKGPVVKTYKYDPTKQITKNANAVSAKER